MTMTFRNWVRAGAILAALSLLAACGTTNGGTGGGGGDGDGGGGGDATTSDVGFLVVSEVEVEAEGIVNVSGSGGFWRSDPAIEDAFFDDPWGELVDTCEVFEVSDGPEDPLGSFPGPVAVDITFLDAGTPVTIASTADPTYLELDRSTFEQAGQTFVFYSSPEEAPRVGPLAGGLSASIPGGEFAAVATAAFPTADAFALTSPADPGSAGSVTTTTEFTWTPGTGDGDAIVTIDVFSFDPETFSITVASCFAADDGSFEFPEAVRAELGSGFSGSVQEAARQSVRVQAVGDARLILNIARSIEYDVDFFTVF